MKRNPGEGRLPKVWEEHQFDSPPGSEAALREGSEGEENVCNGKCPKARL